jgi:CBS-domain-containing membrane protein
MNKTILAMLLGAATASAWWAFALWPNLNNSALVAPAVILSALVIAWAIFESLESWDK